MEQLEEKQKRREERRRKREKEMREATTKTEEVKEEHRRVKGGKSAQLEKIIQNQKYQQSDLKEQLKQMQETLNNRKTS